MPPPSDKSRSHRFDPSADEALRRHAGSRRRPDPSSAGGPLERSSREPLAAGIRSHKAWTESDAAPSSRLKVRRELLPLSECKFHTSLRTAARNHWGYLVGIPCKEVRRSCKRIFLSAPRSFAPCPGPLRDMKRGECGTDGRCGNVGCKKKLSQPLATVRRTS